MGQTRGRGYHGAARIPSAGVVVPPAAEDRVKLVLALDGKARRSALLQAVELLMPVADVAFQITLQGGFSPDGRTFLYDDKGPGEDGAETTQLVTIDVDSGERKQVTRLPHGVSPLPNEPVTDRAGWVNDETIHFVSYANPQGLNPKGDKAAFTEQGRKLFKQKDWNHVRVEAKGNHMRGVRQQEAHARSPCPRGVCHARK